MEILLYVMIVLLLIVSIVVLIAVILKKYEKHYYKQLDPFIFLGNLSDNQKDDIDQAIKYLELTNSIQNNKDIN